MGKNKLTQVTLANNVLLKGVRLRTKGSVHKCCVLVGKFVSRGIMRSILKPDHVFTGIEKISK